MNNIIGTIEDSSMKVIVEMKEAGPQGIPGEKGEKGDKGDPGYTPIKGIDYFDGSDANVTYTNVVNALGYIPLSEDSLPSNLETTTGAQAKANQAEQNAKDYTDAGLANKVDKVPGKQLSTNDYTTIEKNKLAGIEENANNYIHPSTHPANIITETATKRFVSDAEKNTWNTVTSKADLTYVNTELNKKVDKISGKGLSTEDYTSAEKTKLSGIEAGAEVNQNAFSNIKVGTTTIAADSKTDTLELTAGTGITLTPDDTNDKVTVSVASAPKLTTARTISLSGDVSGNTSFDGSANVTITATVADDSHNHVISNIDGLQAALDAKETPTGAQTKADSALASAKNYTDTKVAGVVNSAPEALDTLYELAEALGNDPNFATTVMTEIGTKETPDGAQAKVDAHANLTNNPHSVTKSQVGLGSVSNYGLATQAEAEAGTSSAKYMTPLRTKQAIDALQAVKSVAGKTGTVTLTKGDVGLSNVDNTSDMDKPISTATQTALANKVDNSRVLTDVPANAKFTDTTYSEISTSEIDAGTSSTLRTISGRRIKYILDKVQGWINALTKADVGLGNVDNIKQASKTEFDAHKADGASHSKTARFVVGTSTAGWTSADCDYLCDGTNDQEEINQAIQDLPASGGEVIILDGTYNITAKIDVTKDNVSIRGNGNATIIKRMYNSSVKEGVITLTSRSGCKIANLQIEGNKTSYTNNNNCGIYLSASSNNTITGNTCSNNSDNGIRLESSSDDNTITGNTCNNNNSHGISISSSSNNTVTGNTCNNNNKYGIHSYTSSNTTITGNTCNNNNYGIHSYTSSNTTITGNTCNNNNYGILLDSLSNNTVTGNTCNNNNYSGIYLNSLSNNTVTCNTCSNNDYGILLGSSSNNTVTGNTCIRGTGLATDYTESQHTIWLRGMGNSYNLISNNNCMGKAVTNEGGTGNSVWGNKYDSGDDLPI